MRTGGRTTRSPWLFIPPLYFQQGLPVLLVQSLSAILYKRLGISNARIGLWTSILAWPWVFKMFWSPAVDLMGTKRDWVLVMQAAITAALFGLAFAVASPAFFPLSLALLLLAAFLSATHDIALDGYYLLSLRKQEQAFFLGISMAFFRLAWIFCTGGLVVLAGLWERAGAGAPTSWMRALLVGAATYGALALYASRMMPRSSLDLPARARAADPAHPRLSALEAFRGFFCQPKILPILLFILFYRFGESMLVKMSGLFLLDPRSAGGLGFDTVQTGAVLGSCGVIALVCGGALGGVAVARFGLRACLWPMAIMMHVPNLLYVWAAAVQPGPSSMYFIAAVDQFAYGFGLASYMVYTMYLCQGSAFQTSHYAIVTGLMAFGAMLAGVASGFLQSHLGYFWFFVCVCFCTLPGMFLLFWIPLDRVPLTNNGSNATAAPEAVGDGVA